MRILRFHSYPDCRDGSDEWERHCPDGTNPNPVAPQQPVLGTCSEHSYLVNSIPGRLSYQLVVVKNTTAAEPLRAQLAHHAGGNPIVAVLQETDPAEQSQRSMQRVAATYIEGRCIPRTLAPTAPPTLSPVVSEPTVSPTQPPTVSPTELPTFCGPDVDEPYCRNLTTAGGARSVSQACEENVDIRAYCASTCCTGSHAPTAAPLDQPDPTAAPVTQAPTIREQTASPVTQAPTTREPTASPTFCHCEEAIDLVILVDDGPAIVDDPMTTATRNQLIRDVAQTIVYHAGGSTAASSGDVATSRVAVGSFPNTADGISIEWTSAGDPTLGQQIGSLAFAETPRPVRNTSIGIEWATSTLFNRPSPQNRAVVVILTRGQSTADCEPGGRGCLPQPGQLSSVGAHTFAVGLSTSAGCNGNGLRSEFAVINATTQCFESDSAAIQFEEALRFLACGICPTNSPTPLPTSGPLSSAPTGLPTSTPTPVPVPAPTAIPTSGPMPAPTPAPSTASPVTRTPSSAPTAMPTIGPTTPAPTVPPQCLVRPDVRPTFCTEPNVACLDDNIRSLCHQTCCTWDAINVVSPTQTPPTQAPVPAPTAIPTRTPPTQAPTVVRCSKAVDLVFMLDESSTALGFLSDPTRMAHWNTDPANYNGTNWVSMTQFVSSAASFFDLEDRCREPSPTGEVCEFSRVGVITFSSPEHEGSASARIRIGAGIARDHESLSARLQGIAPAAGSQ